MANSDHDLNPSRPDGEDGDPWNVVLDEDFVRAASVKEPAHPGMPKPPVKRVWPRNAGLALGAAALTFLAVRFLGPADEPTTTAGPVAVSAASTATASGTTAPSGSAVPSGSAASGAVRPMIPLAEVFPAEVKGADGAVYTKVGAAVLKSCTEPDSVGPTLIAMINKSHGCLGHQVALYKDARNNQFNLSVFTMKDPVDTATLVMRLSEAFDDYQVGAQAPPPGSGLPTLAADSGMVQGFSGVGRSMVVGLGQWSDGRVADYQQLVGRLTPLLDGVTEKAVAYETAP
ncbi:hypothetical protein [Kitasatospora camelliae]|uniref:Uncharacterized protein n=1 Tax=Kitasatospora camelliae TaxID=3156397 RepID=A0AAU8K3L5_9ACTN